MRKPIENGLASMNTPRACSISKVSRALWPSASTTWSARNAARRSAERRRRARWPPSITHVGHALLEADLAAQRVDRRAHVLDHRHQPESADVRLG